jgi:gallate dioxygenase
MARILGAITASHTPTIGFAFDRQKQGDPIWAPIFEAFQPLQQERDLVRRRDWQGMMRYGVIFFVLEKLGAVTGVSNLHIYAAMRGQNLEEFQKTRNTPGALYSVAGKETGKLDWDQKKPAAE